MAKRLDQQHGGAGFLAVKQAIKEGRALCPSLLSLPKHYSLYEPVYMRHGPFALDVPQHFDDPRKVVIPVAFLRYLWYNTDVDFRFRPSRVGRMREAFFTRSCWHTCTPPPSYRPARPPRQRPREPEGPPGGCRACAAGECRRAPCPA